MIENSSASVFKKIQNDSQPQTSKTPKLTAGSFMVKGSMTNPAACVVFHYPVSVSAVLPSAGTATDLQKAGWGEHCCHAQTSCSGKTLPTQLKVSPLQLCLSGSQVRHISKTSTPQLTEKFGCSGNTFAVTA